MSGRQCSDDSNATKAEGNDNDNDNDNAQKVLESFGCGKKSVIARE
jgi:hypothetical protein